MAYRIMKKLIQDQRKGKEELSKMADVYFAAGRLTEDEYMDICESVQKME